MTTRNLGRTGKVSVSAAGSTYTDLGGITDASYDAKASTVDTTDFDDGAYETHMVNRKSITMSVTMNYIEDDAGQILLYTAYAANAQYYFRYRSRGTLSGYKEVICVGTIESLGPTNPNDGKQEIKLTVKGTGTITIQNQS